METERCERARPTRDLYDPWPLQLLLWLALGPYIAILTVARCLPSTLGGMSKPTQPPSLRVLLLCWPLVLVQVPLAVLFSPLLVYDYRRYLDDIGEKGRALRQAPEEGVHHGVVTWLFTRYLEHPWFKIDTLALGDDLGRAATDPDAPHFLLSPLPHRRGPRPVLMQGLPQRQLTQLPPQDETDMLNSAVFDGFFKGWDGEVKVGRSKLEGTGAFGIRRRDVHHCPDLKQNRQEFSHQHSLDKSWHVLLAPSDAAEVLLKGWGERGPPQTVLGMAPPGMMLIYAPRNRVERLVFLDILAASSRYCMDYEDEGPCVVRGPPGASTSGRKEKDGKGKLA